MATEMAEVSNRVNFGSWVGRLTCPEKSRQRSYPMISGLVRKKRYGIQCPENIGPASTWSLPLWQIRPRWFHTFCPSAEPLGDGHEGMWARYGSQGWIALNWHSRYSGTRYSGTWLYPFKKVQLAHDDEVWSIFWTWKCMYHMSNHAHI